MSISPTIARFLLDAPVLPLAVEALPVGECFRSALLGCFQRLLHRRKYGTAEKPYREIFHSPVFSGKDQPTGEHLHSHGHAYYLPTDEDDDGRIDHITVLADDGFGPDEIAALDTLRSFCIGDGEPWRLLLTGLGQRREFNIPLLASSPCWISATPFLASRHFKARGQRKDPPELRHHSQSRHFALLVFQEELDRLRQRRPELPPCTVELLEEQTMGAHRLRSIQFQRFRRKAGDDGGRRASGAFRLTFESPVSGPIVLGHSSHFGLGLFLPTPRDSSSE